MTGDVAVTIRMEMLDAEYGGLAGRVWGLLCEAQPKASRANPQGDRRSLPPRTN
jgi:hypothetical protein